MTLSTKWLVVLGLSVIATIAFTDLQAQDDLEALLRDLDAENGAPEPAVEAQPAQEQDEVVQEAEAEVAEAEVEVDEDQAIISELMMLERIRRKSLDDHGMASLVAARAALKEQDYEVAAEQYKQALEFIGNRPENQELREEAKRSLGETFYLDAKQAIKRGDYDRALLLTGQAKECGHPQAERLQETLRREPAKSDTDLSAISHRVNEESYKKQREDIRRGLRRSRQFYTTGEYDKALEECELVLRDHPQNTEAMELRGRISERLLAVAGTEFEATRSKMIADVRAIWTPERYAINSAESPSRMGDLASKQQTKVSEIKTAEQIIQQKLRDIIIPEVNFRPPANLSDAVDFFKKMSRDYDRPEVPIEQRGVNLVLKLPGAGAQQADADAGFDPFAPAGGSGGGVTGVPVIQALSARFISLYDALKLVCEVTGMKFKISGNIVMIVPLNEPDSELLTRSYNVLPSLTDRVSAAQSEMGGGFGGADNPFMQTSDMGQRQDWKVFFEQMGVKWPEGSSISYLATIGKLRITNTSEQLAIFEQVLEDLNVTPRLIEIEARFVEVAQTDLNSLGFEWLLNSDFSLDAGGFLKRTLGLKNFSNKPVQLTDASGNPLYSSSINGQQTPLYGYAPYTRPGAAQGLGGWYEGAGSPGDPLIPLGAGQLGNSIARSHNMGVGRIDGDSYSTGMRYLSTDNNPLSSGDDLVNDKFMRINAFLGNADVSMILHMLSQRSDTDLLSAPKVVTKSGQEAVMKVVTEYIYPTDFQVQQVSTSGGGYSDNRTSVPVPFMVEPQNFEMREVGVILQVVPEVSAEGQMINLMLNPQVVSEPVWKNYGTKIPYTPERNDFSLTGAIIPEELMAKLLGPQETEYTELPMEQPFFHVRSVSTQLSVYNGATVVMGGLITEDRQTMEDKIPFLGDIPYLGRLFRSRSEKSVKRNLLVFVKAQLVDPGGRNVKTGSDAGSLFGAGEPGAGAPMGDLGDEL